MKISSPVICMSKARGDKNRQDGITTDAYRNADVNGIETDTRNDLWLSVFYYRTDARDESLKC